jgi:hypothetical protein
MRNNVRIDACKGGGRTMGAVRSDLCSCVGVGDREAGVVVTVWIDRCTYLRDFVNRNIATMHFSSVKCPSSEAINQMKSSIIL